MMDTGFFCLETEVRTGSLRIGWVHVYLSFVPIFCEKEVILGTTSTVVVLVPSLLSCPGGVHLVGCPESVHTAARQAPVQSLPGAHHQEALQRGRVLLPGVCSGAVSPDKVLGGF